MVLGLCENGGTRDLHDDVRDLCGNVLFKFANDALPKYTSIVLSNLSKKISSISYIPCRGDHTNNSLAPGRAYKTANYTVMTVSVH